MFVKGTLQKQGCNQSGVQSSTMRLRWSTWRRDFPPQPEQNLGSAASESNDVVTMRTSIDHELAVEHGNPTEGKHLQQLTMSYPCHAADAIGRVFYSLLLV